MSEALPVVYLARHGETAWTLSGQQTCRTDLPLIQRGERNVAAPRERLRGLTFAEVYVSSVPRAMRTCALAEVERSAEIDPDLVEWDYGQYEAVARPRSMLSDRSGSCFATAAPGESRRTRWVRAPTTSSSACARSGVTCCCFRAVISCGCCFPLARSRSGGGPYFLLITASLSALGYERSLTEPAIRPWDDTRHVET
jgi:hypothetical protein